MRESSAARKPFAARALLSFAVLMFAFLEASHATESPQLEDEAPRARALLEQAWSAESGQGYVADPRLALALYCHAGLSGSAEGYFRLGRLLIDGPTEMRDASKGRSYLALASQLGHERASALLDDAPAVALEIDDCAEFERTLEGTRFDMRRYIAGLSASKQTIAEIIRWDAAKLDVPAALALAIACAESNFDARAVSPKNAQGVMQLIPDTQKRFGVSQPFDPRQNVRGGVRYLKWLLRRFTGNLSHVAAAYNAGEGAVQRYQGIPPYAETRAYVRRVLFYAGMAGFSAEATKATKGTKASSPRRSSR